MTRVLALLLLLLAPVLMAHAPQGSLSAAGGGASVVVASSDTTDSTLAGTTNVAGLSFAVAANTTYAIKCYLISSSASTLTGVQPGITGPASPTAVSTAWLLYTAANSLNTNSMDGYGSNALGGSNGATRSLNKMHTLLVNGANAGTFQVIVNTEVDTSQVTIHAGSWCEYRKL